jgi:hypothetical protein
MDIIGSLIVSLLVSVRVVLAGAIDADPPNRVGLHGLVTLGALRDLIVQCFAFVHDDLLLQEVPVGIAGWPASP